MQTLTITLNEDGSVNQYTPDFKIMRGSYGNILINVEIPRSLLYAGEESMTDEVRIGAVIKTVTGKNIKTKGYSLMLVKDFSRNGTEYRLYQRKMPKIFTMWETLSEEEATEGGKLTLVINVINLYNSKDDDDIIEEITTTSKFSLDIHPSTAFEERDLTSEDLENIVVNNLETEDAKMALSALQGVRLKEKIIEEQKVRESQDKQIQNYIDDEISEIKTPNGTDAFFDENNKINLKYVSDVLLGQLVFGGTICGYYSGGSEKDYVKITYSANGKGKLNKTVNSEIVKLQDLDLSEYEGVYFIGARDDYGGILPAETITWEGYYSGQWTKKTISYDSGDWVLSNGSEWQVVDNTDAVRTVAGKIGNVILNTSDIAGLDDKLSALIPQNVQISIPVDSWNDSTETSPFLKYALVNVNFSDNATISLVNNDPITFANYGFCIDISSTNTLLKVLSLGTPTESVMLILEVYNEN